MYYSWMTWEWIVQHPGVATSIGAGKHTHGVMAEEPQLAIPVGVWVHRIMLIG